MALTERAVARAHARRAPRRCLTDSDGQPEGERPGATNESLTNPSASTSGRDVTTKGARGGASGGSATPNKKKRTKRRKTLYGRTELKA